MMLTFANEHFYIFTTSSLSTDLFPFEGVIAYDEIGMTNSQSFFYNFFAFVFLMQASVFWFSKSYVNLLVPAVNN